VSDRWTTFLESCCTGFDGVAVAEGAFAPGPAVWVGRREVAHVDDAHTLDVRMTRHEITTRRSGLQGDARVTLRRGESDWIAISVLSEEDVHWARGLIVDAISANLSSAPQGPPPTGTDLERRRRFH
jgi:hypothetical protein